MSRKQKTMAAFGGAVALALAAAWAWGLFATEEEQFIAEIKDLAQKPASEENRDAMRSAMRQRFEGMSPEQRRATFEQMAPVFIPMMAARFESEYDKFMALSPEERQRELDKRIDEMEKARANGQGPPRGGPGDPQPSGQQIDEFRKKMLDWTTPDQRAKFENGMMMMNERREERGLPPLERPGPF